MVNGRSREAVTLRIGLYVLVALTAVGTLFVAPALRAAVARGAVESWWLKFPLAMYGLFAFVFALDRLWQVRRRRYPAGKALYQLGFVLIFSLTLPSTLLRTTREAKTIAVPQESKIKQYEHLRDSRPSVRRDFAYSLGYQGYSFERVKPLLRLLDDSDPSVGLAALKVLSDWSGQSNGQISGIRAWASALSKTSTKSGREKEK